MPKNIILSESQISLLLLEAMSLDEIYNKYYKSIPQEEFQKLVQSDPTFNQQKPNKMGKYGKWILNLYTKGNLKIEDLYKVTDYLTTFIKFYNRIEDKDINHYKSLTDLYIAVKDFNENSSTSHSDEIRKIKEGAEKVYEDDTWLVVVPHTKEASIYYGKHTQWCTAAENSYNMFDDYNDKGPLFININKQTNKKYQFHFQTDSFMDENDEQIEHPLSITIGMTHGLLNFYKKYAMENDFMSSYYGMIYEMIYNHKCDYENFNESNGLLIVYDNKHQVFNLVNKYDEFFLKKWSESIKNISELYFSVEMNGLYNFIDKRNTKFALNQFIDLEENKPYDFEELYNSKNHFDITIDYGWHKHSHAIVDSNGNIDKNTIDSSEFLNSNGQVCVVNKDDRYYIYNFQTKELCYPIGFEYFEELSHRLIYDTFLFESEEYSMITDSNFKKIFGGCDFDYEQCRYSYLIILHNENGYTLYDCENKKFLFNNLMKHIEVKYLWDKDGEISYGAPVTDTLFIVTKPDGTIMLINRNGKTILDNIIEIKEIESSYKGYTLPYNLHTISSDGSENDIDIYYLYSTRKNP